MKYWTTVRHFKAKPSNIRLEHIWKHTLRYGRHTIAAWTVTDFSPRMIANHNYLHNGIMDTLRVDILGDRNHLTLFTDVLAAASPSQGNKDTNGDKEK